MDYNVFVSRDFVAGFSDTDGNIAAGGDVQIRSYSVGAKQPGTDIRAGGHVSRHSASGSYRRGGRARVDFAGIASRVGDVSSDMARLAASRPIVRAGRLPLQGHEARNVFTVQATDVARAREIVIDVPEGSEVVLNITGASVDLRQVALRFSLGGTRLDANDPRAVAAGKRTWLNAPDAGRVRLDGIGGGQRHNDSPFRANLVAPCGRVEFLDGLWAGHIFAESYWGEATARGGVIRIIDDGLHGQIHLE